MLDVVEVKGREVDEELDAVEVVLDVDGKEVEGLDVVVEEAVEVVLDVEDEEVEGLDVVVVEAVEVVPDVEDEEVAGLDVVVVVDVEWGLQNQIGQETK